MNVVARSVLRFVQPAAKATASRTFTTLSPLRPTVSPSAFRPTISFTPTPTTAGADLVPTSAVTSHPALQNTAIRFGPRNTMNRHTRLVQKRRSGFLVRKRSKTGRRILQRRRDKHRREIAM